MANIVASCKNIFKLLGNEIRNLSKEEIKNSKKMRRSIYAKKDIKNEKFSLENINLARPGIGLSPKKFDSILNKKNKFGFIKKGQLIKT